MVSSDFKHSKVHYKQGSLSSISLEFTNFVYYIFVVVVTPEPDSTEDSTGGFDPSDLPIESCSIAGKTSRRMSQPVTGSPKDSNDKNGNRRASEGSNKYPPTSGASAPSQKTIGETDGEEHARMATSSKGVGADWGADASSLSHVFIPTSSSGDACYLGISSNECKQPSGKNLQSKIQDGRNIS